MELYLPCTTPSIVWVELTLHVNWLSGEFHRSQLMSHQLWFLVITLYHQSTSHYLHQCWPRFLLPYVLTRPQWVKRLYLSFDTNVIVYSLKLTIRQKMVELVVKLFVFILVFVSISLLSHLCPHFSYPSQVSVVQPPSHLIKLHFTPVCDAILRHQSNGDILQTTYLNVYPEDKFWQVLSLWKADIY